MTTVYVVTEGDYSSYHIIGVYDDNVLADKIAKQWGGEIEDWELNDLQEHLDQTQYGVYMRRDGTVYHVTKICPVVKPCHYIEPEGMPYPTYPTAFLYVCCFANDEQHAIKIANEKRTQLIASGGWANIEGPSERNT